MCSGSTDCPEGNVCVDGLEKDAQGCDDAMNSCKTGLFCNANKCEDNLAAKADCSASLTACEFGTSCLEVSTFEQKEPTTTCVSWFSIENGMTVSYKGGNDAELWHFCKSA